MELFPAVRCNLFAPCRRQKGFPLPSGLGFCPRIMPLNTVIHIDPRTKVLVWKITETLGELSELIRLKPICVSRIDNMKSEMHKRGFLSVRALLQEAGYSDFDMYYDESGKPHLLDGTHISVSHSFGFSSVIFSDKMTGIDLEMRRDKIIGIANKFAETEMAFLDPANSTDYIRRLTVIWGVKEAIFKIRNEKGISFKDHIFVRAFEMDDKKATADLHFGGLHVVFDIHFREIEDFTLVYAFQQ